jgi:hypothetical protein
MATTVVKHTYLLKGGNLDAVVSNNPTLERREPIVVFITDNDGNVIDTQIKIGDGVHSYNDLPFAANDVVSCVNRYEFPSIGNPNKIYKDETARKLYQWNANTMVYETLITSEGGSEMPNIDLINGGSCRG